MNTKPAALWLFSCCTLIFAVVIVGAITRLTGSGLSITEWNLLLGTVPPLTGEEWERLFALYKESPQFRKENFWMELSDFKMIFFWEWLHRFLARLVGLAYALPLLWFWLKKKIPSGYALKFLGLVALVGLQGFIGWYMVASGLVNRPSVSHYRLALHLSLAFLLYALSLWHGLSLAGAPKNPQSLLYRHALLVLSIFIITFIWGAFTAGLDAGLVYNESFPKMGEHWAPPDLWHLQPLWKNFFENPVAVQFTHRWLAIITALALLSLWLHGVIKKKIFPALHALALMAFVQAGLGIITLFSRIALPLAVAHQAGALLILTLLVICLYKLHSGRLQDFSAIP